MTIPIEWPETGAVQLSEAVSSDDDENVDARIEYFLKKILNGIEARKEQDDSMAKLMGPRG